jgi:hypothetical protein
MNEKYALALFNAAGTFYQCVGEFDTVEQAEDYHARWHHVGLGPYPRVVRIAEYGHLVRLNNEAKSVPLFLISQRTRTRYEREFEEFLAQNCPEAVRILGQTKHDSHLVF